MKLTTTLSAFLLIVALNQARAQAPLFLPAAKAYNRATALDKAKVYLVDSVIGALAEPVLFEMDDHVGRKGTDLTTVAYHCKALNKAGLLFGFFGGNKEQTGTMVRLYAFKHISADRAIVLFEKLENLVNGNSKYLSGGRSNNIMFQQDGITFIINYYVHTRIQVIWNGFSAMWDVKDFKRARQHLH